MIRRNPRIISIPCRCGGSCVYYVIGRDAYAWRLLAADGLVLIDRTVKSPAWIVARLEEWHSVRHWVPVVRLPPGYLPGALCVQWDYDARTRASMRRAFGGDRIPEPVARGLNH